jgi:hypothetical protein
MYGRGAGGCWLAGAVRVLGRTPRPARDGTGGGTRGGVGGAAAGYRVSLGRGGGGVVPYRARRAAPRATISGGMLA